MDKNLQRAEEEPDREEGERPEEGQPEMDSGVGRALLKNRTILLTGEITSKMAAQIVAQLLYMESEGNDPIRVMIDSPGARRTPGSLFLTLFAL